ncbi:hypothetical protein RHECNPAF_3340064 [Rhizobium etli CNPAF512]|nr:hypothetical protein RHECNPAF_3340064 [Rhizobium etli CNPAF512]
MTAMNFLRSGFGSACAALAQLRRRANRRYPLRDKNQRISVF